MIRVMDDSEQREALLRHSLRCRRCFYVVHLVSRSVSGGSLEKALQEALQDERWDCVAYIIQQSQFDHIPWLVKSCDRPEVTDIALRHAVTSCQWNTVTQLVSDGVLTKEQIETVCNEALHGKHFECAVELLRQDIGPVYIQWIVFEVFWSRKWQLIVDLCSRGQGLSREVRKHIFGTAATFRQWDAYMGILRFQVPSDQDLSKAMVAAVNTLDHEPLLKIIRGAKSGLRVFKQFFLKQKCLTSTALNLFLKLYAQDRDLAFYVAVTQELWTFTLELYGDKSVSKKSRQFALRHAIRQRAWQHAVQMLSLSSTGQAERRMAFLECARQGEWQTALELLDKGLKLNTKDTEFAVKSCCYLGRVDGAVELCKRFGSDKNGVKLMEHALEATIKSAADDNFLKHFREFEFSLRNLRCVAKMVVESSKANLLLKLFRECYDSTFVEIAFKRAYQRAFQTRECIRRILDDGAEPHALGIIKYLAKTKKAWRVSMPVLEKWCTRQYGFGEMLCTDKPDLPEALTKWCFKAQLPNMAVFLGLVSENWLLVDEALAAFTEKVCKHLVLSGIEFTFDHGKLDTLVSFLQHVDPMDGDRGRFDEELDSYDILQKCRERGLANWAVVLSIRREEWDVVETEIEACRKQSLIDYTVNEAVTYDRWTLVEKLLDRCSQDDDFLRYIFLSSVSEGNIACAQRLITRVNLPALPRFTSLLWEAAEIEDNSEDMVRLCIGAGISTYQRPEHFYFSSIWCALYHGQLPIVRLLCESGSISNSTLHLLKNDSRIRAELECQRHQDIVQYMDHAASNPASLQHLCRLSVSHLVGCRPGRRERVASLPVPVFVQRYIMFSDLTS